MLPTDMDDNTFMVLDFGNNLYAFAYGAAAGGIPHTLGPMFRARNTSSDGKINRPALFIIQGVTWTEKYGANGSTA